MLDTPCSEVVWRVLATHSIRQFPFQLPSRASPCAITFQLDSTIYWYCTLVKCGFQARCCKVYGSVCHTEGFGLLLAKGCDLIATQTLCKQNTLWSFRRTSIGQLFVLDQGCGLEASLDGFGDGPWLRAVRRSWKGKTGAMTKGRDCDCVDTISISVGHKYFNCE
jgi:hypothetical protein